MVTFCAIIMLSEPFANLSSNNSAFNDEVSTVADGRVSSEGCCRPTRVMSVTKAIWLQKPKSVKVTLVIAPLEWLDWSHLWLFHKCWPFWRGTGSFILLSESDIENTVSLVYQHIKETKGQSMKLKKKIHSLTLLFPLCVWMVS